MIFIFINYLSDVSCLKTTYLLRIEEIQDNFNNSKPYTINDFFIKNDIFSSILYGFEG